MVRDDLTAIMPSWNCESYIAEAIQSLRDQTVKAAEIIVVDDGCSDATARIAAEMGARVVLASPPGHSQGAGNAREVGLRHAATPIVAFADADDRSRPERFALQLAALDRATGPAVVLGHRQDFLTPERVGELDQRYLVHAEPVPAWGAGTMMAYRETFATLGGFETSVGAHDAFGLTARAHELGTEFIMLPQTIIDRRVHGGNSTILGRAGMNASYLGAARAAILRRRGPGG
jgi:glycosyltransferase involved in cell wall biosynthesis